MKLARNVLHSNLVKYFSFVGGYCLSVWVIHLVVMSFVAFFHFLLGHHLSIIEEWASANGWQIILLCKLLSLYVTFKFIAIRDDSIHSFWQVIRPNLKFRPSMEFFVVITFLFLFLVGLGNPTLVAHTTYNVFNLILSVVGIACFYISDVLVINALSRIYRLSFGQKFIKLVVMPLLLFLFYKKTFLYGKNIDIVVYFTLLIAMIFSEFEKVQNTESVLFIIFFIAPFAAIFGLDPLWGSQHSLFELSREIGGVHFTIIFITVGTYLVTKNYGLKNFSLYTYLKIKRATSRLKRSSK